MIALIDDILKDGEYTDDVASEHIESLVETGVYGNSTPALMENSTIEDWAFSIYSLGQLHRIYVRIDIISTGVSP